MELKQIPEYSDYLAGEDGNIYSTKVSANPRMLKQHVQSTGKYYIVHIMRNDRQLKTNRVHRLICAAFHGVAPSPTHTCSHLDGNWKNNVPSNLKWETYSENHAHKIEHGTMDIGIDNSRAKINIDELREIRALLSKSSLTHKAIGEKFNVNRLFITKIANGHRYKGQGF